jgi:hypothetical protein
MLKCCVRQAYIISGSAAGKIYFENIHLTYYRDSFNNIIHGKTKLLLDPAGKRKLTGGTVSFSHARRCETAAMDLQARDAPDDAPA